MGEIQKELEDQFLYKVIFWSYSIILDSAEYSPVQVGYAQDVFKTGLTCGALRGMQRDEVLKNALKYHDELSTKS